MPRAVFISETGENVVKLPDPHFGVNTQGLIRFPKLRDASAAIIVTGMNERVQPRYQVINTLSDRTILNTFGRSVDLRQLSGLCYEGFCGNRDLSGFEELMAFFEENNAVVKNEPIVMTVGKNLVRFCYLLEMQIMLADSTSRIWKFDARLIVEPDRNQAQNFAQGIQQGVVPAANEPGEPILNPIRVEDSVPSVLNRSSVSAAYQSSGVISSSGDLVVPNVVATPSRVSVPTVVNPFAA